MKRTALKRGKGLARSVPSAARAGRLRASAARFGATGRVLGVCAVCGAPTESWCAACRGKGGPVARAVEVVEVVELRGHRRADFKDDYDACRNCGGKAEWNHHVVFRQHVERADGDRWHPHDALRLCTSCHGAAHGTQRIPLAVLRDENYEFAEALFGTGRAYEYLRRRYAGSDPRLEALLEKWSNNPDRRDSAR